MERPSIRSTITFALRSWIGRGANYLEMPRAEFMAAAGLLALMIAFRLVNMVRYRFDSDESQHMHVIWAWARGFVQYRDVFDNHMPLFQIMFSPIFGLIGDRPTILYWMRFILLPIYLVAAWCTYQVGAQLFSRRVAVWAVLLAGFYHGYHFTSFEFRTDNLWALFWLMCVVVLISGSMNRRRMLVAGFLLGFCFAVSMKSMLFLSAILPAGFIAMLLVGRKQVGQSWRQLIRYGAIFVGAAALVPVIIMMFFAFNGIWRDFRYCVFTHNFLPHLDAKKHPAWMIIIFPIVFPFIVYVASLIAGTTADRALAFRRSFVFLLCGFYLSALYSFWTLITQQDFLPYHPLAFVFLSAAVVAISESEPFLSGLLPRLRYRPWPAAVVIFVFLVSLLMRPFWVNRAKAETELLRDVLKLTRPGEYVFDFKGETIFRQRCFRPILEPITAERIQRKLLPDDAPQWCVETRTCLAAPATAGRISSDARQFIARNYLPVKGWVRVAGGYLKESSTRSGALEFESVIPASYEIVSPEGIVSGVLDGQVCSGARFLNPGKHFFNPTMRVVGALAFVWARAIDLHYSPFTFVRPKLRPNEWLIDIETSR
jgi:Dolichyl-phosphate-mannose-protein mannosyltransferase